MSSKKEIQFHLTTWWLYSPTGGNNIIETPTWTLMGGMLPGPDSSILRTTGWKGSHETREDALGLIRSGHDHFWVVEILLDWMWTWRWKDPLRIKCDISCFENFTLSTSTRPPRSTNGYWPCSFTLWLVLSHFCVIKKGPKKGPKKSPKRIFEKVICLDSSKSQIF